ncbi:MBL fold metallo-hydrolase [Paenibacillus sp. N1-5-1-14]|uniref:MBL fold metallo-hydrolase n=1 Tax=Paenibacillus radicibacter TaxID=2972488 RepID=UPI002158F792|nr:MBL fold metallo-hydrolase [Paenibacillus radicibacter]MCR8644625.1 MBL fold metallo-hydrolase [Paenibacillus radicibacter]
MQIRLIRHATLWVEYADVQFLIDPMFSDKDVNPPIVNSSNTRRNPLVPLQMPIDEISNPDVVLVTHLHQDHFDQAAIAAIPKHIPIICQPGNETSIQVNGFADVTSVEQTYNFQGITIIRTSGQHGTGEIGEKMGRVSGFIFQAEGEPTLYIAGDTIWCDDVRLALESYQPDVTIVNSGGAQFNVGDPITMDANDVIQVSQFAPYTKVIAVHMDTINHCLVTRRDLRERLIAERVIDQVVIPQDGEWF